MPIRRETGVVAFDTDRAVEAALSVTDDLRLVVAFTDEAFETVYADEAVTGLYADESAMRDHFGRIHDYVGIDFSERDLFAELFRGAGDVNALTTHMDHATVTRVLVEPRAGLLLVVDSDAAVGRVVHDVRSALDA